MEKTCEILTSDTDMLRMSLTDDSFTVSVSSSSTFLKGNNQKRQLILIQITLHLSRPLCHDTKPIDTFDNDSSCVVDV